MRLRDGLWRSRWAAVGAAVAVSCGLGGALGIAGATITSGDKPVYVPIAPCRLLDTRATSTVGPRSTPIGADSVYTATVRGANGNCNIPTGAVGIMMNTTVANGTAGSFLSAYPADATRPTASNLNWTAGQAATPNEIAIKLSSDGKISLYNFAGTVDVIGDIVGYYEDHRHNAIGQVTLPAQALNETSANAIISRAAVGLLWQNNALEGAEVFVRKPADFAGTGTVTLKMIFTKATAGAGGVQFFARPRDYNDGDPFLDSSGVFSNIAGTGADTAFHEVTISLPAGSLSKDWWDIVIQREDGVSGGYTGDVIVRAVEITYANQ